MTVDFLIIGQGLAGSLLAWQLIQQGYKVLVIDNGLENASQVAAGLINPITGMRLVKSAEVDTLLPVAKQFYGQLADFFQQDFYIEKPMLRIFNSAKEQDYCEKRLNNPYYQPYLGDRHTAIESLNTPFGAVTQQQTGYLLTRPLLACLKDFFMAKGCYQQAVFDVADIQLQPTVCWQGIVAKRIIFCEGYHAMRNPYFAYLPFQPVKGEILTLAHRDSLPDAILNYGQWLIPLLMTASPLKDWQSCSNLQLVRIGATFDWQNLNNHATELGKQSLLNGLKTVLPHFDYQIQYHQANVRPCTLDKQPFIGFHPNHPQLAIFNGFGAKGSLQIPWYSQQFANTLIDNAALPAAADIQRYVTA
jgi:glycine/D-amino acid oxidase-like deaminating enzyme